MTTPQYRLGWHRDLPDDRDLLFEAPASLVHALPASVDLTPHCPPVYSQGDLGSCTANAIAAAFEFDVLRQGLADFMPSRLFIYYYERLMEGTVNEDSGAAIRDGIRVVNKRGACSEAEWPYDISKFTVAPPVQCSVDALKERAVKYRRIPQRIEQMKACLASGLPFVFGIDVYESFMAATDGNIPMPAPGEQLLGGHALLCASFDDATQRFGFQNSWGASWGNAGRGTIPYDYLASSTLAADFWEIQVVGDVLAQIIAEIKRVL